MCDHKGTFSSPGAVQLNTPNGVMLFVPVVCRECGDVRLRMPVPDEHDEKVMERRAERQKAREKLTLPNLKEVPEIIH